MNTPANHPDPGPAAPGIISDTSARAPAHGLTIQDASAWVLRGGVVLSVLLMLTGMALSLSRGGTSVSTMTSTRIDSRPAVIWAGLRAGEAKAVIEIGIYLLVLTPILRVATSMVLFAAVERDRLYALVTFVVLAMTLLGWWLLG